MSNPCVIAYQCSYLQCRILISEFLYKSGNICGRIPLLAWAAKGTIPLEMGDHSYRFFLFFSSTSDVFKNFILKFEW